MLGHEFYVLHSWFYSWRRGRRLARPARATCAVCERPSPIADLQLMVLPRFRGRRLARSARTPCAVCERPSRDSFRHFLSAAARSNARRQSKRREALRFTPQKVSQMWRSSIVHRHISWGVAAQARDGRIGIEPTRNRSTRWHSPTLLAGLPTMPLFVHECWF